MKRSRRFSRSVCVVALGAAMAISPMSGCAGSSGMTDAIQTVALVATIPLVILCGQSGSRSQCEGQYAEGGSNYDFLPSHQRGR